MSVSSPATCTRCDRSLEASQGFVIAGSRCCARCTLFRTGLLRRSLLTALFVGTVLTLINHGPEIFGGQLSGDLAWKVPLTYCVPFLVTTWGALINSRP